MLCSYQRGQPGVPDTSGRCRTRTRASDTSSLRVDYVDRALGFASCRPDGEARHDHLFVPIAAAAAAVNALNNLQSRALRARNR